MLCSLLLQFAYQENSATGKADFFEHVDSHAVCQCVPVFLKRVRRVISVLSSAAAQTSVGILVRQLCV